MKTNWKFICVAAGLLVLVVAGAAALCGNFGKTRAIAVSGECLASAPKDRAAITLRVRTADKNAAESMKLASSKMSEITAFLKTVDVRMQTTQFDSYEKTEWDNEARKSVALGFETNIAVEVSADKMETIEAVLAKFAGMENVYTENLRMFTSAETLKPIMEKCLGDAILNARRRARTIAAAEGRKVGRMISAEYGPSDAGDIRPANFLRASSAKMEAATFDRTGGFVSKDTDVSVGVSAVFEIR
jgi:uncharacterized protein YggE